MLTFAWKENYLHWKTELWNPTSFLTAVSLISLQTGLGFWQSAIFWFGPYERGWGEKEEACQEQLVLCSLTKAPVKRLEALLLNLEPELAYVDTLTKFQCLRLMILPLFSICTALCHILFLQYVRYITYIFSCILQYKSNIKKYTLIRFWKLIYIYIYIKLQLKAVQSPKCKL